MLSNPLAAPKSGPSYNVNAGESKGGKPDHCRGSFFLPQRVDSVIIMRIFIGRCKMNLRRTIIHGLLCGPYLFHKLTGSGAFGPRGAQYLPELPRNAGNPLKAALFKHHVKQYHEASCSVASVAAVINTMRTLSDGASQPVTQAELLEKVRTGFWKERMSAQGHNGRRGLPLPLLGEIVKGSLDAYGLGYGAIETVAGTQNPALAEKRRQALRKRLTGFETRGDCLIIAHFGQGVFLRTLNIPHISPVGGFEPESGDVTILDVDPDQLRPYKVAFDTFCRGIFSRYPTALRPFGYRTGGYVYIRL